MRDISYIPVASPETKTLSSRKIANRVENHKLLKVFCVEIAGG